MVRYVEVTKNATIALVPIEPLTNTSTVLSYHSQINGFKVFKREYGLRSRSVSDKHQDLSQHVAYQRSQSQAMKQNFLERMRS